MITKEKALEIARSIIPSQFKIESVVETKNMYVFYDERADLYPIGYLPVAIKKDDGSVLGVFYPDLADEIDAGKEIAL